MYSVEKSRLEEELRGSKAACESARQSAVDAKNEVDVLRLVHDP